MKLRHYVYGKYTGVKAGSFGSDHTILCCEPNSDFNKIKLENRGDVEPIYSALNSQRPKHIVRAVIPRKNKRDWIYLRIFEDLPLDSSGRRIAAYHAIFLNQKKMEILGWQPQRLDLQLPTSLGSLSLLYTSGEKSDSLPPKIDTALFTEADPSSELAKKASKFLIAHVPSVYRVPVENGDPIASVWSAQSEKIKSTWGYVAGLEVDTGIFPGKELFNAGIGLVSLRGKNTRLAANWIDLETANPENLPPRVESRPVSKKSKEIAKDNEIDKKTKKKDQGTSQIETFSDTQNAITGANNDARQKPYVNTLLTITALIGLAAALNMLMNNNRLLIQLENEILGLKQQYTHMDNVESRLNQIQSTIEGVSTAQSNLNFSKIESSLTSSISRNINTALQNTESNQDIKTKIDQLLSKIALIDSLLSTDELLRADDQRPVNDLSLENTQ